MRMRKTLLIVVAAALALAAAFGIWRSVSGDVPGDRGKASIPSEASTVNNAEIVWGPIIRFSAPPLPSKRVVMTRNILILDHDLPSPFVAETKNARVRCDLYYTRGWGKVVRKQTITGTWRPPHIAEKDYGGQLTGQVRCGPFTVWKKSKGLWLGINPRVTYEGVTFDLTKGKGVKGDIIRRQLLKGANRAKTIQPVLNEEISFLPRVAGGSIYPALGTVPYGSPVERVWETFGRPPEKTCSGSQCYWATIEDRLFLQLATPYDSVQDAARPFDRVVLSSRHPTVSQLAEWKTPEGIHLGSSIAELRSAYPAADCVGRRCNIAAPLQVLNGVRYRFELAIGLDAEVKSPDAVVESIDVSLTGAEGTCRPTISFREQGIPDSDTTFLFTARCSGKLKSVRLEPHDGSTQLGEAETNERVRLDPKLYAASGSTVAGIAYRQVSTQALADGAYTWQIGCETPDPADPAQCAPGRGPAGPAWDPGLFEEWDLVFRGTSSVASGPQGRREVIAPLRLVAEFADRPTFTYVLREAF